MTAEDARTIVALPADFLDCVRRDGECQLEDGTDRVLVHVDYAERMLDLTHPGSASSWSEYMAELRQETEPRDWYRRISHDERHLQTEWRHFEVDERAYDAAKDALGTVPGDFFLRRLTEDIADALTRIGKERVGRDCTRSDAVDPPGRKYSVERHSGFEFSGWTGNRAIADLTVIRREGMKAPVVIATERDDNPGVSVTNGVEYLAVAVLAKICPNRALEIEPFLLVEHHRAKSFDVGDGNFEGLEHTFHQVRFSDFRLRGGMNGPNRVGEVVAWGPVADGIREIVEQSIKQPRAPTPAVRAARELNAGLEEPQRIRSIPKEALVKDTLRPWDVEQIGEYYLSEAHATKGNDGNVYQIDAGTYPIVGKVSNDGRKLLLDTALVYTGRDERTREEALIPMKMAALEIVRLQAQGKAKVNEDFKARVDGLAKGVEQGRELAAGISMRR